MNALSVLQIVILLALSLYCVIAILILLMNIYAWVTNKSVINVPFVPVPTKTLADLESHININDKTVLYDLGSGDGKIVCHLYLNNRKGTYVGIERSLFPYLLSLWKSRSMPRSHVRFLLKDLTKVDLSPATDVTLYLFPEFLDEILPKLERELKSGTKAYSVDFRFSKKEPLASIPLDNAGKTRGRNLYIYEF